MNNPAWTAAYMRMLSDPTRPQTDHYRDILAEQAASPALLVAADYLKTSIHHEMTQAEADAAIAEVLKEVRP